MSSIAFPSISTGAYGYPIREAAGVAVRTVREVLEAGSTVSLVRFVLFSEADLAVYRKVVASL